MIRCGSPTLLLLLLAAAGTFPAAVAAQAGPERVEYTRFDEAAPSTPDVAPLRVGFFGGGLDGLEARRPDLAPLAARFRMQRRSGLALGVLSLAAGAIAFSRYTDFDGSATEIGDQDAMIYYGAMGLMAGAAIQLSAAQRSLSLLAYAGGGGER